MNLHEAVLDTDLESQILSLIARLREEAKIHPSRELSLAITNIEQGLLWYQVAG